MRPSFRFSRPIVAFASRLVLGAVVLFGLASAAAAQIIVDPAPNLCIKQIQPVPSGGTDRPADDFGFSAAHAGDRDGCNGHRTAVLHVWAPLGVYLDYGTSHRHLSRSRPGFRA